jgi:hypothetical protein
MLLWREKIRLIPTGVKLGIRRNRGSAFVQISLGFEREINHKDTKNE